MRTSFPYCLFSILILAVPVVGRGDQSFDADPLDAERFFETEVRPILVQSCGGCHGSQEQSGGLRVDSRESLLQGGHSGPAIVAGAPAQSRLLQAVRREGDLAMPPDEPLPAASVKALERWVEMGAPWPGGETALPKSTVSWGDHWAVQPTQHPTVPSVQQASLSEWPRSPVDAFVLARLNQRGLDPSPVADRRTLIRRVSYTLTGLPPRPDEVERFVNDKDPLAYERLVDRLLASPQYGEQWARHWLDIARYSDTKGYVYAREERHWVHAWAYRDWVVEALNEDMPYDRFLLLQLAADQVGDRRPGDLAAMGFLTLGRRFLGVQRDIIDDRIDVVCRGTMGLTVACARCHDHKYDPIPTADYYSLYGVFQSCLEQLVPLQESFGNDAFETELDQRQTALAQKYVARKKEASQRARERIADYLFAQSELEKYPANGFDQIFQPDDLLPAFVRRWERYLRETRQNKDPIFVPWHRFAELPADTFAQQAGGVTEQLRTDLSAGHVDVHPLVARAFESAPRSFREVCDRYGEIFGSVRKRWEAILGTAAKSGGEGPSGLPDPQSESLRRVLYGLGSPCQVPQGSISNTETFFSSNVCTELWKLQGELDRWIIQSETRAPFALTLVDRQRPIEPRIFVRGDPLRQGKDVPRQFLSALSGKQTEPFQRGSGRLELARAIIDPDNPLTARVLINRVWGHHFGEGLVMTPSDFGNRADPPSHPKLLDWLASRFVADGWSLKELHRRIVLSATFRQSSLAAGNDDATRRAVVADPENRSLWRMNVRRLSFEEFRDSLLSVTNDLDRAVGGKPEPLFEEPFVARRTVYGKIDRQYLPGTLRVFDFASPDLHVAKRTETTVPQQALFFMNDPFVLDRASRLAENVSRFERPHKRVAQMFRAVFQRQPTEIEIDEALSLVAAAETVNTPPRRTGEADWSYGFGMVDEEGGVRQDFTPLPHFTGDAWQGGPRWPDPQLGWVQLTAEGGHPGNDRRHAAVRRWTAPRDMMVDVRSRLQHEPTQGDGIRAFVVSSRHGMLAAKTVHHDAAQLDTVSISVTAGDTIDFVVDIGDVLNSDQYLWKVTIEETDLQPSSRTVEAARREGQIWDSAADFPSDEVQQLGPWEQLAQVMLCANEFLFID